ncbi:MAG: 50S ribosomal protein L21 [Candidatus Anoxychlamydiales bacterium]|nr:50S ribosomal protein L21 [Candidatus Anoxychlamydiales bacterium]
MYAILETGGKQYRVEEGSVIEVELLKDVKDNKISFNQVLLLNDGTKTEVGMPTIKNCSINAEVLDEIKGPKVIAYKYKRRKNYHRKKGHRQKYLKLKITKINKG